MEWREETLSTPPNFITYFRGFHRADQTKGIGHGRDAKLIAVTTPAHPPPGAGRFGDRGIDTRGVSLAILPRQG